MSQNGKKAGLGTDALLLTVSKVLTMCISMVISMLLARLRTLEEYGTYSQMLLVINLFSSIFMLGLPNSINYFLGGAENREQQQRFLSVYYTASTALTILLGAALVCGIPLIEGYFRNPGIRTFAFFLAIYPWANLISSSISNVLVAYRRTKLLMVFYLVQSILLLGIVLVVQLLGLGFRDYMICLTALFTLLALSVYCISSRMCGGIRIVVDWNLMVQILKFSIPLGLASIVGTLSAEIDKLLIGKLMSTAEMAIYSNAAKELPVAIVASSFTAVLMPRLVKKLKQGKYLESMDMWADAAELSLIVMGLVVCGIFTYAEDVVELLYSAKYLPGVPVFRVYTLILVLRITYFGIILNSLGRTRDIFYCSIGALALNATLNPLLYLCMGMIGPAVATFLSILLVNTFQLYLTSRYTAVPFRKVFPWYRLFRVLCINAAFGMVFLLIKRILPGEVWLGSIGESIALGLVWAAAYFLLMKKRVGRLWRNLNVSDDSLT